ncbi:MAG: hypothetical protein ACRC41_00240 [Sarcina sp.]
MAHSKLYRSFIILQEDERGHSVSKDKPLSGYAKIEVKGDNCKIAFYAQNLKNDYGNCHMMLICNKKDAKVLIELGSMNITEQGKVESSHEYDSKDIGKTGFDYEKVVGAAIYKEVGGQMVYLMCGFLNGEQPSNNWKEYSKVHSSKDSKPEKKSYVKDDDKTKKKYDDDKDKNKDKQEDTNKSIEKKEDKTTTPKEKDCGCKDREAFDKYEENIDLVRGTKEKEPEFKGAMGEFFSNIVAGLEEVSVTDEIKNVKWYKVPVSCFEEMCNICNYNKYTTLYYPMLNYYPYIIKCGYFMVGLKHDDKGKIKYLVYGIKGTKEKVDQPYSGKTGFVTFVDSDKTGEKGCWLMFYDFRNSMVVVPMK